MRMHACVRACLQGNPLDRYLRGIMPNSFIHLFRMIEEHKRYNPNRTYLIRASYLQIYQVHLQSQGGKRELCDDFLLCCRFLLLFLFFFFFYIS